MYGFLRQIKTTFKFDSNAASLDPVLSPEKIKLRVYTNEEDRDGQQAKSHFYLQNKKKSYGPFEIRQKFKFDPEKILKTISPNSALARLESETVKINFITGNNPENPNIKSEIDSHIDIWLTSTKGFSCGPINIQLKGGKTIKQNSTYTKRYHTSVAYKL